MPQQMMQYTDEQFNHIIEVLFQYKKCCPKEDVYLNEKSIKQAFEYFMKIGIFNEIFDKEE
jgi:hypothetical protein